MFPLVEEIQIDQGAADDWNSWASEKMKIRLDVPFLRAIRLELNNSQNLMF